MRFFNRTEETAFLKKIKDQNGKHMIVLYGPRRIGKTYLLRNAYPEANYFFVDTRSSETLLKDFSRRIFDGSFENWDAFFKYLLNSKRIVIIDEFQNFLRVDPSIFSILQNVWDSTESNILLILSGSYVGMMKKIFLDLKEPLFGRSEYLIQLKEFNFFGVFEMLKNFGYTLEETITWYAILGGVPKYLWYLESKKPFETLIEELFFGNFAPLKEEGKNLLVGEFGTEHPGYFAVLEGIGYFDREIGEICDRTKMERTKAMKYINELMTHYDIVEKVENKLSKSKRGARYKIKGNFLSFWFKYIYSNQDTIEFNPKSALDFTIKNINEIIGRTFEEVVKFLMPFFYKNGVIPVMPESIGKHWLKAPDGKVYEFDIVGETKDVLIIFECKWRNKKTSESDLNNFIQKCKFIKDQRKHILVFVSKSGFESNKDDEIIKIDLDMIEEIVNKEFNVI
ncbi:MAG: ATP-binding protein [Athalassotoga sp.]|uniref:ATP-binding protein n=2 Tax=Athalassotoga sp. TaxID=2022597 RepID=UPI003D02443B